jgi:hypothetical protein
VKPEFTDVESLLAALAVHGAPCTAVSLRRWAAVDVRVVGGLISVTHRDAVVTLAPLTDDGSAVTIVEENPMDQLDRIRQAQVIDIAWNGNCAARRAR